MRFIQEGDAEAKALAASYALNVLDKPAQLDESSAMLSATEVPVKSGQQPVDKASPNQVKTERKAKQTSLIRS